MRQWNFNLFNLFPEINIKAISILGSIAFSNPSLLVFQIVTEIDGLLLGIKGFFCL